MKLLFLCHVEEMFRSYFPKGYVQRIIKNIESKKFNRIILLDSNIGDGIIEEIQSYVDNWYVKTWDWSWGYENEMFHCVPDPLCSECNNHNCESNWIIESNGHDYTWVPNELRTILPDIKNMEIFVGGGYESECLADWECVLNHLDITYKKLKGLVY